MKLFGLLLATGSAVFYFAPKLLGAVLRALGQMGEDATLGEVVMAYRIHGGLLWTMVLGVGLFALGYYRDANAQRDRRDTGSRRTRRKGRRPRS